MQIKDKNSSIQFKKLNTDHRNCALHVNVLQVLHFFVMEILIFKKRWIHKDESFCKVFIAVCHKHTKGTHGNQSLPRQRS